jgi:hypothetical protein
MRLSVLLSLALFLAACSDDLTNDKGDLIVADLSGAVRVPLLASAADGTSYRLTGATFEISGSAMVTLTDRDPKGQAEELVSPLPAGGYSMYLRPGWQLVSIAPDGTTTTLTDSALLRNPIGFDVTEVGTASPELVFKVGDRELSFGRSGNTRLTSLEGSSI